MSGSTSQPSAHRSSSDIRQDIASYVLKHQDELSDVPGVKKFLEHHGRLAEEIVASKKLGKRLAKAREKYEPFEKRVLNCQDALKNAETKLAKLHRPLGESTFKAFISGSIAEQSVYSDRLAVQKRIRELRKERYSLSPSPDAGVVQKTKAKAHQLAIAARVKLEEMKCGRLETEIGRHLVENELDASAQCESTSELWGRIATCRGVVTSCSSDLQQANSARGKASKQLCDAVPLQHIESSKTFDAEIKSCQKHIRDSESSLLATTRSLAEELAAIESSKLPKPLVTKLGELKTTPNKDASELFKEAGEQFHEATKELREVVGGATASSKRWWGGVSKRGKAITAGMLATVVLAAMLSSNPDDTVTEGGIPKAASADVADANDTITEIDFSVGPNGEEIKVGGDGLESDWYFHYYVDTDGEKILHGTSRVPLNGVNREENLRDRGELVSRSHYDAEGRLTKTFKRLTGNHFSVDEFRDLANGEQLHLQSVIEITKSDTGENQTIIEAPHIADDKLPSELPSVVGRELRVTIGTVDVEGMPGWVQTHNGTLSSVKCHATDSEIVIDFNVDSSKWVPVRTLFPLLIRIFDKNGQYLTHLQTAEGFTTFPSAYEESNEIYRNLLSVGLTEKAQEHNCFLLKPRNNRLVYSINVRDLRDAAQVEIGFLVR